MPNDIDKCITTLDKILNFKQPPTPSANLGITDANKLLKFLKISTKNPELIKKCEELYKIVNPN
jgi:hypothetical protein